MSYTKMMVIQASGEIETFAEFSNSHGFAPRIWTEICRKYLGNEYEWLIGNAKRLWPLYKDESLPLHWRVALACTFDYAIVATNTRQEVADCLRKFESETKRLEKVDHLPAIADKIESIPPESIGACFHQSSVSENLWRMYDEEKGGMVPYSMVTGDKHFFVMELIRPNL